MKNSVSSRIKITARGKIVRRPMAVDHFRTNKSKNLRREKRGTLSLGVSKKTLLGY